MSRVSEVLRTYAGLYVQRLGTGLEDKTASGSLSDSIEFKLRADGFNVSMLPYWVQVDEGRKAGKFPPLDKIKEWLTYPRVQDRFTFGREDLFDESKIDGLAFVIGRKIAEKGTKGNSFVTKVVESDLTDQMVNALADATAEDILELI